MISHLSHLVLGFVAGAAIGAFYFGGLWWTVRRIARSPRPALWSVGSFYMRTTVSLLGFYVVMGGHWDRLVVGLAAFTMVRLAFVRRIRTAST